MADTITLADWPASSAWHDIVVDRAPMGGVPSFVQNKGPGSIFVVYADAEPVTAGEGNVLSPGDAVKGTAAHIWIMSTGGACNVACGTLAS